MLASGGRSCCRRGIDVSRQNEYRLGICRSQNLSNVGIPRLGSYLHGTGRRTGQSKRTCTVGPWLACVAAKRAKPGMTQHRALPAVNFFRSRALTSSAARDKLSQQLRESGEAASLYPNYRDRGPLQLVNIQLKWPTSLKGNKQRNGSLACAGGCGCRTRAVAPGEAREVAPRDGHGGL